MAKVFNLSDNDQGMHKHAIKKKYELSALLKKNLKRKGEKKTTSVFKTTFMHTKKTKSASKKKLSDEICLSTKIDLQLIKNSEKTLGSFKVTGKQFCVANKKKVSHTV